jgi:hypothetical protein
LFEINCGAMQPRSKPANKLAGSGSRFDPIFKALSTHEPTQIMLAGLPSLKMLYGWPQKPTQIKATLFYALKYKIKYYKL